MPCEAAKIIGITPDGVRVMERTGRLPALKTADGWRIFRRSDVEQAAEQRAARKARRVR
ncbi:MAG: MerR family transcriptional regulator [Deltaproteobacteria bacterium]|nr:MerR family transcriptional regulator [Deltaproteobacteria bacterium]